MQRAKHSRFFGRIYSHPKPCDIIARIVICVNNINRAICVGAFKHLIGSFANVIASTTRLTCISRWNSNTFHTIKQSLILNILSKHRETPFTKFSAKRLVSFFTCKSNSSKVFNSDSITLFFSSKHNRFCNCMINYISVSFFPSRKPFQKLLELLVHLD